MVDPGGTSGPLYRLYSSLYWLGRSRILLMALGFLMAALVSGLGLQANLLPEVGEIIRRQSIVARACFVLFAFLWVIDGRFYPISLRGREAFSRQPARYQVFFVVRLLLAIAVLGIAFFQTYKTIQLIQGAGCSVEEIVKMFFALYEE